MGRSPFEAIYDLPYYFVDLENGSSKEVIKGSVLSEYLAHQPVEDYQPLKFDFLDEDIVVIKDYEIPGPDEGPELGSRWKLALDGSSNYNGHDVRVVLMNLKGGYTPFTTRLCFDYTNNVVVFNNEAPIIQIEQRDEPAYYKLIEEEIDGIQWFHEIKRYLLSQEYPEDATLLDKKTPRRLSSKFFLSNYVLYKRNHGMVPLRCMDRHEAGLLIKDIHERSFGTHDNGHAMATKILRAGYYWFTTESDCFSDMLENVINVKFMLTMCMYHQCC
ncbi:hypothetical protein KIW84_074224 [Lathyrus oleraceus]|uniref:Uncharacterized protein n=1 Tax=Pisum sativum TaxID=3888 RepID=A0A9D4VRN5_PEA|nr:hypothetical protein KIW84_074224 [Pisum sativum]